MKADAHMDAWFTGADFASIAVDQLRKAIRRRQLLHVWSLLKLSVGTSLLETSPTLCLCLFLWHCSYYPRYGFNLSWQTGRACDIAPASKKFLKSKSE